MGSEKTTIRLTDERARWIEQVKRLTGEKTRSKAIDAALRHMIHDSENKQRIAPNLDTETLSELSTRDLPLDVDITVTIGQE